METRTPDPQDDELADLPFPTDGPTPPQRLSGATPAPPRRHPERRAGALDGLVALLVILAIIYALHRILDEPARAACGPDEQQATMTEQYDRYSAFTRDWHAVEREYTVCLPG